MKISSVRRRPARRGGFSFTEILFAVMILGIGFIMVAAMFPVAIRQTQASSDETIASTIAQEGVNYISKMASAVLMPVTIPPVRQLSFKDQPMIPGRVFSFRDDRPLTERVNGALAVRDARWAAISGNLILPSDQRYAWVPFYRRDQILQNGKYVDAPYAQVIVVGVQVRNTSLYDPTRDIHRYPNDALTAGRGGSSSSEPATLEGRLSHGTINPPSVQFPNGMIDLLDTQFIAEGTFIIVSDDNHVGLQGTIQQPRGYFNGRVYRIGNPVANNQRQWEFEPANGPQPGDPTLSNAQFMVIGKGYTNPAVPTSGYSGAAQDIAVYTTFVKIN